MARILYGVAGEGMGHAIRSKPIIEYLIKKGHKVKVLSGDRPYNFLKKHFKDVDEIFSLLMTYKKNTVSNSRTLWMNIKRLPQFNKAMLRIRRIFKQFRPELVITDCEPFSPRIAKLKRIPVISIDNPSISTRTKVETAKKYRSLKLMNNSIIRGLTAGANHFIITTFFYPEKKKRRTYLVPLIIRDEIQKLKPKKGKYILVYQTSQSNEDLIPTLKRAGAQDIIEYPLNKVIF